MFSNEVDIQRSPLKTLDAGSIVSVHSADERMIGVGFASPASLVCVRLITREPRLADDWLMQALKRALAWRTRCYSQPYYRLVFAEADGLPGLVVDRYDDLLVAQLNTWGMEKQRGDIEAALKQLIPDSKVCFDDSGHARALEGLQTSAASNPDGPTHVVENGVRMQLPAHGQKTGWFFDQRNNRKLAQPWFREAKVLDLYSYAGGWGIQAGAAGAASVTCVDSSQGALDAAAASAAELGLSVQCEKSKVEDFLVAAAAADQEWDLVVLDPPALIRRRRDESRGTAKYRAITRQALGVVKPGGVLVSCSCSVHLDSQAHLAMARSAARAARRQLVVVGEGGPGADHPTLALLPESRYLSCWYFRVD